MTVMVDTGPMFYVLLGLLLVFFFFVYLMIRRTVLGFKEGMERGKRQ
ncbi:MAG: hypothetical protein ACOCY7_01070 [Halodesulfurarchaeum sp.]